MPIKTNVFVPILDVFDEIKPGMRVITNVNGGFAERTYYSGIVGYNNGKILSVLRDDGVTGAAEDSGYAVQNKADLAKTGLVCIVDSSDEKKVKFTPEYPAFTICVKEFWPEGEKLLVIADKNSRRAYSLNREKDSMGNSLSYILSDEDKIIPIHGLKLRCYNCEKPIYAGHGLLLKGMTRVCPSCSEMYRVSAKTCTSCGVRLSIEIDGTTAVESIVPRNNVCIQCKNESRGEFDELPLNDYNFKPKPKYQYSQEEFKKELLFLGAEMEVNYVVGKTAFTNVIGAKKLQPLLKDWAYMKTDGSIRAGIEIVTHPATLTKHRILPWEDLCKKVEDLGFDGEDIHCGFHVHASKNCMSVQDQMKLAFFVNSHKTAMSKIARRTSLDYAKFITVENPDDVTIIQNQDERYRALNWQNKNTVEFRLFKGTHDYKTVLAYLECVHSTIKYIQLVTADSLKDQRLAWKQYTEFVKSHNYLILQEYLAKVLAKKISDLPVQHRGRTRPRGPVLPFVEQQPHVDGAQLTADVEYSSELFRAYTSTIYSTGGN